MMLGIPINRRNGKTKNGTRPSNPNRSGTESSGSQCHTCSSRPECKQKGKLKVLLGQEREFSRSVPIVLLHPNANADNVGIGSPCRCKVTLQKSGSKGSRGGGVGMVNNKHGAVVNYSSDYENADQNGAWGSRDWKFQAEVLRAECNLLRMEKQVAVRRWEQGCAEMENAIRMAHSLHSAVQTLVAGRKKIVDEKNAEIVLQMSLQNQIEALQNKLQKLQRNSELREKELKKCVNFDRRVLFPQRTLDRQQNDSRDCSYSEDTAAACSSAQSQSDKEENTVLGCWQGSFLEGQLLAEASLRIHRTSNLKTSHASQQSHLVDGQVAMLRRRLNSPSMVMNESKETVARIRKECRSMLNNSGNCSSRRMDRLERAEQGSSPQNKLCSERCKATIQRIAEQVQAETQQWSQMEEILHHVREEMEDLQKSRDFWEDHALHADEKIATLQAAMHEWRQKARSAENKISNLQSKVAQLRKAVDQMKHRHALEQTMWLDTHSSSTLAVLPSISAKSSTGSTTDSENLDHYEASVDEAETSNQSGKREKVDHPTEGGMLDETKDSLHVQMGSPLTRSGRASRRMFKGTQSSHVSRHDQFLINKASKLSKPLTCSQSSGMHFQQNDCVAEQLSGQKNMKKLHVLDSKRNITVQSRLSRENIGNRDKMNRHQDHLGSRKSSSGRIRLPLADIGNASPFRIQGAVFPLSRDEII